MKHVDRIPLHNHQTKSFVREGTTASCRSVVKELLKELQ